MTETPSTSAGATQQTGTTGLNDGPGADPHDRPLIHGGTPVPPDNSASVDADHPGMPAGGDPGADLGTLNQEDAP
jgi:hypothetical protein